MKITALIPLEKNPFKSKGDEQIQQIANSIQNFEKMMSIRPIIYDETNVILGGNKRFFALKMLGYKDIPETWAKQVTDLSEEEKREFIVKDNAHWGSVWDYEMLQEWNVDLSEWGVDVPEWNTEEPYNEQDYSDKNKEIDTDDFSDKMKMTFEFSSEEYSFVIDRFSYFGVVKEEVLLKLLKYEHSEI